MAQVGRVGGAERACCGWPRRSSPQAQSVIKIDGSSTVFPIAEASLKNSRRHAGSIRVTVGLSGTGGGFKNLSGEIDIRLPPVPILTEGGGLPADGMKFIELPVAFDAITIVVNPKNVGSTR